VETLGLVGLVWLGWFVEVDLIRLWVGHGETPRCDQGENLEEML
jgi:hypothetical protein